MSEWIIISIFLIVVLVLIGVALIIIYWKKKNKGEIKEPNYRVFFNLGLVWLPAGVVFVIAINTVIGIAFLGLGASYLAIGLGNRDKWEKK
jgi:hypothetical protein